MNELMIVVRCNV